MPKMRDIPCRVAGSGEMSRGPSPCQDGLLWQPLKALIAILGVDETKARRLQPKGRLQSRWQALHGQAGLGDLKLLLPTACGC